MLLLITGVVRRLRHVRVVVMVRMMAMGMVVVVVVRVVIMRIRLVRLSHLSKGVVLVLSSDPHATAIMCAVLRLLCLWLAPFGIGEGTMARTHPLPAPSLLLGRSAQQPPLLLVPRTQALAAEREVVVVYYYRLHPAVALPLRFLVVGVRCCIRHEVAGGVAARVLRLRRRGNHDQWRGIARVGVVAMVMRMVRMVRMVVVMRVRGFVRGLMGRRGRVWGSRLRVCRVYVIAVL